MSESYLGRGFEPIAGKPFGWAWNREREEIRDHLKRRGRWHGPIDEFLVTRIQQRLNREHRKRWRARQEAWRARQPKPDAAGVTFTIEELERLVELFAGGNDPVTLSIATKAAEALKGIGGYVDNNGDRS